MTASTPSSATQREADQQAARLPLRALFFAGVQQHDDEDEQHHDGAGVHDDLHGGDELRAQQQVQYRERAHHHDQRQRAVDGMPLQQQIQCSRHAQPAKDDKQNQMHVRQSFTGDKKTSEPEMHRKSTHFTRLRMREAQARHDDVRDRQRQKKFPAEAPSAGRNGNVAACRAPRCRER